MIFIKKQTTKILQLVAGCTSNLADTATEIWLIGATLALGTLPDATYARRGQVVDDDFSVQQRGQDTWPPRLILECVLHEMILEIRSISEGAGNAWWLLLAVRKNKRMNAVWQYYFHTSRFNRKNTQN